MDHSEQYYIDGVWVDPIDGYPIDVINPATEEAFDRIVLGGRADVDRAVAAAKAAFPAYARSTREDRLTLLRRFLDAYSARLEAIGTVVCAELGAPLDFAIKSQAGVGIGHLNQMIATLETYRFEQRNGNTLIAREPIGVCALITPWNWPLNQILCKVLPALAAGCTVILKPSELTPLNAILVAEALDEAGVPKGVFNLVQGDGPGVGQALSAHPDVDMVSFTGSTRAGILVAKAAAETVKRVHQELGGKSANIILADADIEAAIRDNLWDVFSNSGQTCVAPSRTLVHASQYDAAIEIAQAATPSFKVGDPAAPDTRIGPVVSAAQFAKVQDLIASGLDQGARLVAGGLGRPEGFNRGYYVRPTVFADVRPGMRIYAEEIFGPVVSIIRYETEDEAIAIANDTEYGLAGYVQSSDLAAARRVASRIRAGRITLNGAGFDFAAPFGGYKRSGNGREFAEFGLDDFLEIKSILGYQPG